MMIIIYFANDFNILSHKKLPHVIWWFCRMLLHIQLSVEDERGNRREALIICGFLYDFEIDESVYIVRYSC